MFNSFDYYKIKELIKDKKCQLITTKEEFDSLPGTATRKRICIELSCTHKIIVTYNSFRRKITSICKKCCDDKLKIENKNRVHHEKEFIVFNIVENIIKDSFYVIKTNEGCKANMIIKPKDIEDDLWLPIQLKHNNSSTTQYSFTKINNYPQMLIICMTLLDNRFWFFNGSDIKVNTLTIGINNSKYEECEVKLDFFKKKLLDIYNNHNYIKEKLDKLMIPVSNNQQVEHKNRLLRESILKDKYQIEYPLIDGSKWNCKINGKTIQDKCLHPHITCPSLLKCAINTNYELGMIDYYWFNITNTYLFYCIPEKLLQEYNLFDENHLLKNKMYFSINPTERMKNYEKYHKFNEYLFDYNNFDQKKFENIFK